MQSWLAAQANPIEWIWVSSALRAQSTAAFVANANIANLVTENALYLASPESILDTIRSTPPDIDSVAVVAHNPGLTHMANMLSAEPVTDNLVTFGIALFAYEHDWSTLTPGHCHFVSIHTPKTI